MLGPPWRMGKGERQVFLTLTVLLGLIWVTHKKKLKICSHNLYGWLEEIKVGITLVTSFPSLIIEMY